MKITLAFADFAAAATEAGYLPQAYSDNIHFVKPSTKGAGKVELNVKSGTFIVGSGSKHLEAITAAVGQYFRPIKYAKGWSIFAIPLATDTGTAEIMADFVRLVGIVEKAVPATTGKAPKGSTKAPKAKDPIAEGRAKANAAIAKAVEKASNPQSAAQIMRAAEIKAKNLATMKAVTAKMNQEAA
jgi:hypothetical protein